ncbi:hypothetical protein [Micromonospora sp. CPCC 206061]|uniref:hypothetical protein n=1 Tax=Micromonospora sp. CPCC 206061 TaxID=3122410 RepID=UPI002FEF052B
MPGLRRLFAVRKPTAVEVLPWIPTLFGVALMIGLMVISIVLSLRPDSAGDSTAAEPGALPPPIEFAVPDDPEPTAPPPSTPAVTPSASVVPTRPAAPVRTTPGRETPPDPEEKSPPAVPQPPQTTVTGRYQVLDSFGDSFIGEVLVSNRESSPQHWTVRLRFPSNVGNLRTFWVEGAPQGSMRRSGDTYIFTSGVPVNGRSSVPLRFHYDRVGSGDTPSSCTVNGATCSI